MIAALIAGARIHVEAQTRRALITQSWRLTRDVLAGATALPVLPAPLRTLDAARVYDSTASRRRSMSQAFVARSRSRRSAARLRARALPAPGAASPASRSTSTVGYGDAAVDVPEPLRQAIRLLVAHWYENRGLVALGQQVAVLPQTVAALIAPYRVLSL